MSQSHKVFIEGETIDLCIPSKLAIEQDGWADWFNDPKVCENLDRGVFPHYEETQYEFLDSLKNNQRFAVMIKPKNTNKIIGIISLSEIRYDKKSAQISIIIGGKTLPIGNFYALEAMALVTEHGFEKMGLNRIWAGQAIPKLCKWNKFLELLGYKTEGILRDGFVKGREVSDIAVIACLYNDYKNLKLKRGGSLWSNAKEMKQAVRQLPKEGFADKLVKLMNELEKKHFNYHK